MMKIKPNEKFIALGSSEQIESMDRTKLPLVWANNLANEEKVLFINWSQYDSKLSNFLESIELDKSKNLRIDTQIDYFGLRSFFEIIEAVEKENYKSIFIDDVFSFSACKELSYYDRSLVIKTLKFITKIYDVRVVIHVPIDSRMFLTSDYLYKYDPELGYFNWCRLLINDCDQVIAFQDLSGFPIRDTQELYEEYSYKIFYLKDTTTEIDNSIINLKNY